MASPRITLALLTFFAVGALAGSYQGCITTDQSGKCIDCYKRKALPSGDGCGPKRAANDHCTSYFYESNIQQVQCNTCDPGYALKIIPKGAYCVRATLQDCHAETIFEAGLDNGTSCDACTNGKYSVTTKRSPQRVSSCKEISNPIPHCKYGGVVNDGTPTCYKCNPGYTVAYGSRRCFPSTIRGCWIIRGDQCLICDPEQGYSINSAGYCYKSN